MIALWWELREKRKRMVEKGLFSESSSMWKTKEWGYNWRSRSPRKSDYTYKEYYYLRMIRSNDVQGNKEDLKKVRDINDDKRRDVETKGGWFQDLLMKMIIRHFVLIREMLMIRNEWLIVVHFINIVRWRSSQGLRFVMMILSSYSRMRTAKV